MLESKFQQKIKLKIETMFPGCFVLKNDPTYLQGFPDLLILYKNKWAILECKDDISSMSRSSSSISNQKYYIKKLDKMSFARFIYPQNEEEVLYELQQAFKS